MTRAREPVIDFATKQQERGQRERERERERERTKARWFAGVSFLEMKRTGRTWRKISRKIRLAGTSSFSALLVVTEGTNDELAREAGLPRVSPNEGTIVATQFPLLIKN